MTGALLFGLGTGVGLWLIVVGWLPRPPRLALALDAPYGLTRRAEVDAEAAG